MAVTWYKLENADPAKYEESRRSYEDAAWAFYGETEPLLAKASRLASDHSYQELRSVFRQIQALDADLTALMKKQSSTQEEWQSMQDKISHLGQPVDKATSTLATEFGFSVAASFVPASASQSYGLPLLPTEKTTAQEQH